MRKTKAWACVGTHGHLYYCEASGDPTKEGRFEIFNSKERAERMALGKDYVREVTIIIHKPKKEK